MNQSKDERIAELELEVSILRDKMICKRCGHDNNKDDVKINEELLKDYYKSMLRQSPFKKEYELMSGSILVTCVEPSRKLISLYSSLWDMLGTEMTRYSLDLLSIMLVESISYKTPDGLEERYKMEPEERLQLFKGIDRYSVDNLIPEYFQNMPQVVSIAIQRTVADFNATCLALGEAAQDENFWKGAGLA